MTSYVQLLHLQMRTDEALAQRVAAFPGGAEAYLRACNSHWSEKMPPHPGPQPGDYLIYTDANSLYAESCKY
jgi:hypothetical protein